MSARTRELYDQASTLSPEELSALAQSLSRLYEDEMDNREADEVMRRIESGGETTVPLREVMAKIGLAPLHPAP